MTVIGKVVVVLCALWLLSFSNLYHFAEAGKRFKRELRFPKGSSFTAAVALASFLPKGPTEGLAHVLEFDLGFPFPEKFVFGKEIANKKTWQNLRKTIRTKSTRYQPKRPKRDLKKKEKMNLLFKIEDAITRIGFNGTACVSRFLCELRNISPENSFLEELLFSLFKTSFEPNDTECGLHDRICPVSLLQIIMHSKQISPPQIM